MNRQWMYGDRHTSEYIKGVREFLNAAEANKQNGFMCCPCTKCVNTMPYSNRKILHSHLLYKGFMPHYNVWAKHGEREVTSLYIYWSRRCCVMVPSLLYVVASVELNKKHKIKMKTLNVKELNGKHTKKGETQYETPKPSKTPKPLLSKKKAPAPGRCWRLAAL